GDVSYEEWLYGQPPEDVDFIRFVGDEVVRVTVMKVDGQKIVRTAKEVGLEKPQVAQQQQQNSSAAEGAAAGGPKGRPTLRRPGEEPTQAPDKSASPLPPPPGDGQVGTPGAPPQPGNPMPTGPGPR